MGINPSSKFSCLVSNGQTEIAQRVRISLPLFAALYCWVGTTAHADESYKLTIKDHTFVPTELAVSAGQRLAIEVENLDSTPAEFESSDLRVEKIVVGGGKIVVRTGPLKAGTYKFFDDYHPDTARGTITAVVPKTE